MRNILMLSICLLLYGCNNKATKTETTVITPAKKQFTVNDSIYFERHLPVALYSFCYDDLMEFINTGDEELMRQLIYDKKMTFADSGTYARITAVNNHQLEIRLLGGRHSGEKVYIPDGFFTNE